ncbi:MAG TPA: ECF-type sigma factor [Gemmatimonadaceae bacterium]|nr:ECF-type sigma factor [Gemmatimonadaceae bacterium]
MSTSGESTIGEVTRLLDAARGGDRAALDRLIPLVYDDLRRLAGRELRRELGERTMHATALVHDLWLKLAAGAPVDASSRTHFMAIAGRAMRQVLVDQARRRRTAKRGGDWHPITLGDGDAAIDVDAEEMLALDDALERLDPRQRQVVEMRFFAGMEEREIAEALGISERTIRREWTRARAQLYRTLYLQGGAGADDPKPES